jgi:hypothetical protein
MYSNLGLHAEAEPLVEEALAMRRRVLGADHEDVAASLRTLADVRRLRDARRVASPRP